MKTERHNVTFSPLAYCRDMPKKACWKALALPLPDACPECGGPIHTTAQVPFFLSEAPYAAFFSGAGCGKTMNAANKHLMFIIRSGKPALVYAEIWTKHILMATLPAYLELWEGYPEGCHAGPYNKTERMLPVRCANGNIVPVWFRSIDEPDSLLGPTLGSAHGDECCLKGFVREAFDNVDLRLRAPLPAGMKHQHILSGTPDDPAHWTFEEYGNPEREEVQYERFVNDGVAPVRARAMARQWAEDRPWWHMVPPENIFLPAHRIQEWRRRYEGSTTAYARRQWYGEWAAEGEGRIFEPYWFGRYDAFPGEVAFAVDSWDTAQTAKDWSTYTVSQTWLVAKVDGKWGYYLTNMDRVKLNYGDVKVAIAGRQQHSGARFALIEERGSGQTALQELAAQGVRVRGFKPGNKDKYERANRAAIPIQEGRVFLPSQDFAQRKGMSWLGAFEREVFQAPHTKYWDIVDCMSQLLIWAEQWRWAEILNRPAPPVRTIVGDERRTRLVV